MDPRGERSVGQRFHPRGQDRRARLNSSPPAPPSADELRALARKYETLARLRRERAAGAPVAPRAELRALAREFPGALRELDTVPYDEIERRRDALMRAADGGASEAWMAWMVAYHATMRVALVVKARLARAKSPSEEMVAAVAAAMTGSGTEIDAAFVRTIARPPRGRVNAAVFDDLGRKFGVRPESIWDALFPSRRADRS